MGASARMDRCLKELPPLYEIEPQHQAACYLYDENKSQPAGQVSEVQR